MTSIHGEDRARRQRTVSAAALALAVAVTATVIVGVAPARAADVDAGRDLFQKTCGICHSTAVGVNQVGPSLWNVYGRKVASVPNYNYSPQLRAAATAEWDNWDAKHLDAYLSNPRQVLKGVKMFYAGPDATDRANVIAYLRSLR